MGGNMSSFVASSLYPRTSLVHPYFPPLPSLVPEGDKDTNIKLSMSEYPSLQLNLYVRIFDYIHYFSWSNHFLN